jgi:hypothetical protein
MIRGLSACPIFAYYINRLIRGPHAMAQFLRQKSRNYRELRLTSDVFYLSR